MSEAAVFQQIAEIDGSLAFQLSWPGRQLLYMGPHCEHMLGYPPGDLVHFLRGDTQGGAATEFGRLLQGLDERVRRYDQGDLSRLNVAREIDWQRLDGSTQPLLIHSRLLGTPGAVVGLIGLMRDNSPKREWQLAQKRFASMLNHEFRTPLATIDGAVQRLESTGKHHDEPTRERYRKIQAAVDRLIGMLDDYLSPERMALTGHKPRERASSPLGLLEEAAALVRQAGRAVQIEADGLPAQMHGDASGLRLALKMLVENAVQYAPAPATIRLVARPVESGLELLVIDNGPGIAADDLPRIFQKAYRGINTVGTPGNGLGLYMARSVIEVQGGSLTVQSGPEGGAVFKIALPLIRGKV